MFGFMRSKRDASPAASNKAEAPLTRQPAAAAEAPPAAIADMASLRDMQYVPLSKFQMGNLKSHVACMQHPEKGYLALISKDAWAKPVFFDAKQRLIQQSVKVALRPCEPEIVQTLHNIHAEQVAGLQNVDQSSIERLTDEIFNEASAAGASDIHIECRSMHADVMFRVYGQRVQKRTISKDAALSMAGLLFDVRADHGAKRDIKWSPDTPMDAVIDHVDEMGRNIQVRFASAPMHPRGSFQLVCRLLKMDPRSASPFVSLGYTAQQLARIEEMIIGAQGLVLLVGPTNSGKSTTMQALARRIMEVRGDTLKIESIEDPVEYIIPGAVQMPVSSRTDFADLLKSTLRHDPDVLLVGEVRDAESAESIKNIVLAGRKVLATLHAYDAMAAWSRLAHIGLPADVLFMSGFISGIVYQRLLPKLCPHCSLEYESARDTGQLPASLVDRIERVFMMGSSHLKLHNPGGCSQCNTGAPGYKGRVVCAEYVVPNQTMLDALREGRHQAAKNEWMRSPSDTGFGGTAIAHALMLLAQGLVDPRDVESQVSIIRQPQSVGEVGLAGQPGQQGRVGRELPSNASNVLGMDGSAMDLEDLYERSVA